MGVLVAFSMLKERSGGWKKALCFEEPTAQNSSGYSTTPIMQIRRLIAVIALCYALTILSKESLTPSFSGRAALARLLRAEKGVTKQKDRCSGLLVGTCVAFLTSG